LFAAKPNRRMSLSTDKTATSTVADTRSSHVVCLVDDDLALRKSVSRLLESEGLSVQAFAEPREFLNFLAGNSVEVAVLDIWMDGMTGMELMAHLCAQSPRTRVIFITGREDRAAERTVKEAGAYAFFLKPFDDEQFLSSVRLAFTHSFRRTRGRHVSKSAPGGG
jgi:two-component system, LuxR family, response regulator FixJ